MYKVRKERSISKLGVFYIKTPHIEKTEFLHLSEFFWDTLLSKKFLKKFVEDKYKTYKKEREDEKSYNFFLKEYQFLLEKIEQVKNDINLNKGYKVPSGEDVFFSYRIFTTILSYYNEYYRDSQMLIKLSNGILFGRKYEKLEEFFSNLHEYSNSKFSKEILADILQKYLDKKKYGEFNIFKFEIFWPDELITVGILSKLLKKQYPKSKIVIDFSTGNEQFDFSQWIEMIRKSQGEFFEYYDFFIVNRDFGTGITNILKYLNKELEKDLLKNVIYLSEGQIRYIGIEDEELTDDMFENFITSTFDKNKIDTVLGTNAIFTRFLPYKCYWNNCNFCAINSQNKFTYNTKYSYEYFIDLWIDFIKKYNIVSINFKDEAIPPKVIIHFAKKVIANGLQLNYQFRTRFEKLYTKENCALLYASGARFCGMGLESAVDRVNEEIGNKGNGSLNIKEKIRVIHNFDSAGIRVHNYSIIGFPGESDAEAEVTYKFLKSNILKSSHFTCTPNIFGLMKGPEIFSNREKYGISVKQKDIDNPFKLIYDFEYNGMPRNMDLLTGFEEDLHRTQFLPWLDEYAFDYISATDFWSYIDRSYMFYLLKRYHKKNPFYKYKEINDEVLNYEFSQLKEEFFNISNYLQFFEYPDDENIYVYDWVLMGDIILHKKYKTFLENYKDSISLGENIEKFAGKYGEDDNIKMIYELLKFRILTYRII